MHNKILFIKFVATIVAKITIVQPLEIPDLAEEA